MATPPASETQTPAVNPPSPAQPSPPPTMTAASFYVSSPTVPSFPRSPLTGSLSRGTPRPSSRPSRLGDSGPNPVQRFGASRSWAQDRNNTIGPGLKGLGPVESQREGRVENADEEPVQPVQEKEEGIEGILKTKLSIQLPQKGKEKVTYDESSDDSDDEDSDDDDSEDSEDDESDDVGSDGEGVGDADGDGDGDGVVEDAGAGDGKGNGDGEVEGDGAGDGDGDGDGDGNGDGKRGGDETHAAFEFKSAALEEQRTWDLRPRKPLSKSWNPDYNGMGGGSSRSGSRPASRPRPAPRRTRPRPQRLAALPPAERQEALKKSVFSISLTKEEIEEDFLKMTGALPPKKPQKRPKNVQKDLDELSPAMYLTPPTPDMYDVDP